MAQKHHLIATDLETDDLLLLKYHAFFYPDAYVTVVVGESKPCDKMAMAIKFMYTVRPNGNFQVIQGLGSDKEYPIPKQNDIQPESAEVILQRYANLPPADMVFLIKPPREELACTVDRSNSVCFCYGSFNWRSLKTDADSINVMVKRFRMFYYYDSFQAIGEKNSGLFCPDENDPADAMISDFAFMWNSHILNECIDNVSRINAMENPDDKAKAKRHRNQKIIDSITPNIRTQYVMADVCVILCEMPTVPVRLSSFTEAGYPVWVLDESSNLRVHNPMKPQKEARNAKLVADLSKKMKDLVCPIVA